MPTTSWIGSLFEVDPAAGRLVWKAGQDAGREAGTVNSRKHRVVRIHGKSYRVAHLIYAFEHGVTPGKAGLKFLDGNTLNCRSANLMLAGKLAWEHASVLELVRSSIAYDATTGELRWTDKGKPKQAGEIADRTEYPDRGYRLVRLRARVLRSHRVAFMLMTGAPIPDGYEVDHINRDRSDNRWSNLRLARHIENCWNASGQGKPNLSSGIKGVSYFKPTNKWFAYITVNRKRRSLGYFASLDEAASARRAAADRLYGEFARHD